jgi:hypothetical protein
VQQFEGTAAILENASPEAKLRAKEMEKIGYKGDDAIEADEVKVYRAHVRLICVDVEFIVRGRLTIAPRRAAASTSAFIDFPAAALSMSNTAKSSTHVHIVTQTLIYLFRAQDPLLMAYVNLKLTACGAQPVKATEREGLSLNACPQPHCILYLTKCTLYPT